MILGMFDAGTWLTVAQLVGVGAAAYIAVLWAGLVMWTYGDIRSRTDDTTAHTIALATVAVFFLPGLLLYIALRPQDQMIEAYYRRLEGEAFLHELRARSSCPDCRRAVESEFILCPYCRATLRSECPECGVMLAEDWAACPYCTAERRVRRDEPVAAASTTPPDRPRILLPEDGLMPRRPQPQTQA